MDRLRFVLSSIAAVVFGRSDSLLEETVTDLDIFRSFVTAIESVPYHTKWLNANKNGDTPKWVAFRDGVLAGQTPTVPTMATKYGTALVDAGEMVLNQDVSTPPTPPPLDPAPEIPDVLAGYDIVVSVPGELEQVGAAWAGTAYVQAP